MIATSSISVLLVVLGADRREGEGHDFIAVVVDVERDDLEFYLHPNRLFGSLSVRRDSTRTTLSSWTRPTQKARTMPRSGRPCSQRSEGIPGRPRHQDAAAGRAARPFPDRCSAGNESAPET